MSVIFSFNVDSGQWSCEGSFVAPNPVAYIGFVGSESPVNIKHAHFGLSVAFDENVYEFSFPPNGVEYETAYQSPLVSAEFPADKSGVCRASLWCNIDGVLVTEEYDLSVELPEQPYPSWTWDGSEWVAPFPEPEDGWFYDWNEDAQAWERITL